MKLPLTGSQTVGPYFAIGLNALCSVEVPGDGAETFVVEGQLLDGNGAPIPDGFLEIWQANAEGVYPEGVAAGSVKEAAGFARVSTAPAGSFRFTTARPGAVPYDGSRMQAPHLLVLVYMRGLLRHTVTRMYFPDEPANLTDPVLQLAPAERRHTLIATAGAEPGTLHWNIVMRDIVTGKGEETVFFAW
jgi:protocatechuate 3,4-dioxygenase alpha subunit